MKYENKLLENTAEDGANGILTKETVAVSLKYLSNFWTLLEMPLINCKVELKFKWTKYSVFSEDKKLSCSNFISKRQFERSIYWNDYKTKAENKNTTNEFRYFPETNFVGINRLFVLVSLNRNDKVKRFNARKHYLLKGVIKSYNVIMNGKNFYNQPIGSDIKPYEETRKLITEQGEDYTIRILSDFDLIKNHYRLIAVDLSREKELDAYPKINSNILNK